MIETIGVLLTTLCILMAVGYAFDLTRRRGGRTCAVFAFAFAFAVVGWIIFMLVWAAPPAMDYRQWRG